LTCPEPTAGDASPRASATWIALGLVAVCVIVVLLHVLMIAGAANCSSDAPDWRCSFAKFFAG